MRSLKTTVAAAVLALGIAGTAQAALTPITTPPVASGPFTVVFAFADAADTSDLSFSQGGNPPTLLITNNGPTADPIGFTTTAGAAGTVNFILTNTTQGYSFTAGIVDPVDGVQHAVTTTNFADFGVGALPADAAAAIAATGQTGIFIGFEDRRNGDYDYNDLIYWFSSVRIVDAPAPAALGLFGLGLLGLGLMRRRA
ncbi:PEP-CTERM sorting domain-containing protein [Roseococcus sp. DSY-14]|uniref:PEP-CTERM sorting domain-containing protein n=1 Tax=Roseococcus sp. DSY-14 TaxID=3369650 RepID=UPI00387A996D